MSKEKTHILLIADFNIENLSGLFNNDEVHPQIKATAAPFDQAAQILMDDSHECWKSIPEYALVWTTPDKVSPAFAQLKQFETTTIEKIKSDIDQLAKQLIKASTRVKALFVATWTIPPMEQGLGMLDLKSDAGVRRALQIMNSKIIELLNEQKNIFVLDSSKWIGKVGSKAISPKLWYLGKIPFANEVFLESLYDIKAAINGIEGKSKKLIVVDLDNTLWGGIVGDIGWENIRLGGHDPVGEAFKDFQQDLKALTNRGILLGIVSKNEEKTALEAIEKHPEMILHSDNFAGWKINWNDKAQNLADLVSELNLGMDSVVFIDDNPVERDRVRESFPEVLVPEMPEDKLLFPSVLKSLRCFDNPVISDEDRIRTEKYRAEQKRKTSRAKVDSIDDWLKSLETVVTVEPLFPVNLERTAQLLNKTNQMNLSTRRMTADALKMWSENKNHEFWTFRVADKFGDSGLVGILSLEFAKENAAIVDFVLSCRVMGRKVEETMAHLAIMRAKKNRATEVTAKLIPTERNSPCLKFWQNSGFQCGNDTNLFKWEVSKTYELPGSIKLIFKSEL